MPPVAQRRLRRPLGRLSGTARRHLCSLHRGGLNGYRDETIRILQANLSGLELDEITFLYQDVADLLQLPPVPSDAALQAMLDREDDPAARTHQPSAFVDLSFLREIEQGGFLASLPR